VKSLWMGNKLNRIIPLVSFIICMFIPSIIWSAGFHEQKLYNTEFYSSKDLKEKIQHHTKEIISHDAQIKNCKTDIDWLVLKVNQIQDSGRIPFQKQKGAILKKQKRLETLLKGKKRLEHLIQLYSSALESSKEEASIDVENISPKKKQDKSDGISKIELHAALNQEGLNDWVEIIGTGNCLSIKTILPILFPTGSAKVANEYNSFFQKFAQFLKSYDVKILVNGYADTVPIHNKRYPSNFELGATRAANIVHQLVNYGLKPSIFKIETTGKHRFAAKGMSKQKSFERRAEVTVIFSG